MFPYIQIVLPSYGVFAFIGFFTALIFLYFRKDKYSVEFSSFIKIFICGAIGLIIGSKILYAVTQIPWLIENFSIMNLIMFVPQSGFVFYGGLLGTIAGVKIYIKKSKYETPENIFNMLTPAIPLFHFFGRIGCYLAGCCYGRPLHSHFDLLGIRFNRVPTQLIEALYELILFVVCLIVGRKQKTDLLRLYLFCYGCFRFIIEFFRGDTVRGFLFGLSTSQWVSIAIVLFLIADQIRRKKQNLAPTQ